MLKVVGPRILAIIILAMFADHPSVREVSVGQRVDDALLRVDVVLVAIVERPV